MAAESLQNTVSDVTERLQMSFATPLGTDQMLCDFSLREACESAMSAVMQSLPARVEVGCYLDTTLAWVVYGFEPTCLKRILLHLADFLYQAFEDTSKLFLLVSYDGVRAPTREDPSWLRRVAPPSADEGAAAAEGRAEAAERPTAAAEAGKAAAEGGASAEVLDVVFEFRAMRADGKPATIIERLEADLLEADLHFKQPNAQPPDAADTAGANETDSRTMRLWFAQRLITRLHGVLNIIDDGASLNFCVPYQVHPCLTPRVGLPMLTPHACVPYQVPTKPLASRISEPTLPDSLLQMLETQPEPPKVVVVEDCELLREAIMCHLESWHVQVALFGLPFHLP